MAVKPKFEIGDKVRVNKRAPQYIKDDLKWKRTRAISLVWYDSDMQCCFYELYSKLGYAFRSYMLTKVKGNQLRKIGRPKTKRGYKLGLKLLSASQN